MNGDYQVWNTLPVDTSDPVSRHHPLNQGKVAWWLTLPEWYGGRQWIDLMSLYPGTLTNMASASVSGWRGTTRPGGWGHLLFDGVDDYVDSGTASLTTGEFAVALWAYSASGAGAALFELKFGGLGVGLQKSVISGNDLFVFPRGFPQAYTATQTFVLNQWNHIVLVHHTTSFSSALNFTVYCNGTPRSITAFASAGLGYVGNFVGRQGDGVYFPGQIDDVGIWNRALSDAEVASLYNLSRLGYPGMLNRVNANFYVNPMTFLPAWAARSNTLLTGAY